MRSIRSKDRREGRVKGDPNKDVFVGWSQRFILGSSRGLGSREQKKEGHGETIMSLKLQAETS